jgi:tetratricopeptide (TPR) repeat protein
VVEALPRYEEAAAMLEQLFGTQRPHPDVILCLNALGGCFLLLGRLDDATLKYQAALEMSRRMFAGPHPTQAESLHTLAETLRRSGRLAEAERYAKEAVELARAHPEWGHDILARSNGEWFLSQILQEAGRADESVTWLRGFVQSADQFFADEPDLRVSARLMLGWAHLKRAEAGDAETAESLFQDCRDICKTGDVRDWQCYNASWALGESLAVQGRFAEAEPPMLSGFGGLRDDDWTMPRADSIGMDFKQVALDCIVRLYERWHVAEPGKGYDAEAAKWRARLEAASRPAH